MKAGYLDVSNGCAGDMLVGSLIDAGLNLNDLKKELEKLPLKNYKIEVKKVERDTNFGHKIEGTKFIVKEIEKWDDKTEYKKIIKIIEKSSFANKIKKKIIKVFDILAEAESIIHKEKKEKLHFHQIGQIDAIIEIISFIVGIELLGIKKIFSSSVGISNPAPVTCEILKGIPVIFKNTDFEITTPTGAAITKAITTFFPFSFNFYIEKVGYGAGMREYPLPNMVKFFIGKVQEAEGIYIIETNIDDMSPVLFSNLIDKLLKAGALDVSIFQGIGKKNRPVFKIEIICPEYKFKEIGKILFKESTTIGFRYRKESRIILEREIKEIETELGKVRVKISYLNGEKVNISPEYEDCKKISEEKNIPLKKIYQIIYKSLATS
ncbi:MAG: nickel pincer cofactor biosynthesis protein LarC [Candidatus Omnitrophica bacterium]|nr:nickel pincer cofactor biosynthesis protein LarC [Candidatus Omnitrophota bacterium]